MGAGSLGRFFIIHKGAWLIATCVGWGAFTIAVGSSQTVYFAAAMVAAIGWLSSWNMSLNRGLLQMQIDPLMRGRIMSIDMMSHGLMPLGVIPISIIAEFYDVATALMVAGAAFVIAILLLTVVAPSVRRVEEGLEIEPRSSDGSSI